MTIHHGPICGAASPDRYGDEGVGMRVVRVLILVSSAVALLEADGWSGDAMQSASRAVVSRYRAVFENPPRRVPNNTSVDGPLLGNGDMLASLGVVLVPKPQHVLRSLSWQTVTPHPRGTKSPQTHDLP